MRIRTRKISRSVKVVAVVATPVLLTGVAVAASNWAVSLSTDSSASGQSATIQNVTITATSSPAAGSLLYPGGTGDAVAVISNPNPFPVTITAVQLPANTTYAAGYTDNAFNTANSGCTATTPSSGVTWSFANGSSGSTHSLTAALTVAAASNQTPGTLDVTLTNAAAMASTAPLACANTYFKMPALVGVTATGGAATATTSPATSSWTS